MNLLPEEAHVWVADRTALTPLPAALAGLLSAGERERAQRFFRDADRDRFSIGRSLLRRMLGRYAGLDPRALAFGATRDGKPVLDGGSCPVRFNVSHSGDLILLAFARDRDLGVDVEQVRPEVNIEDLAPTCFSPVERAEIFRAAGAARQRFFEYWAAKEAWMKADGRGMTLPLCDYTLAPLEDDVFRVSGTGSEPLDWTVRLLNVRSGYTAAVATGPGVSAVRTMTIEADAA